MKKSVANQILLVLVVILTASLVFVMFHSSLQPANETQGRDISHHSLMQLIRLQNETISLMEKELVKNAQSLTSHIQPETINLIHRKQAENAAILTSTVAEVTASSRSKAGIDDFREIDTSDMENDCEDRFGLSLVSKWRENRQIWCADSSRYKDTRGGSELVCYRYHQHHKKREGQGVDVFCVAKNFVIDFSKVLGVLYC